MYQIPIRNWEDLKTRIRNACAAITPDNSMCLFWNLAITDRCMLCCIENFQPIGRDPVLTLISLYSIQQIIIFFCQMDVVRTDMPFVSNEIPTPSLSDFSIEHPLPKCMT